MSEPLYTFPELTEKDLTAVRNVLAAMPDDTLANLATLSTEASPLYPLLAAEMEGRRKLAVTRARFNGPRGAIRSEIALNWDDPWGSCLSNLGGICDVLYAAGAPELVPESAGYSPGMGGPDTDDYPAAAYLDMLKDKSTTLEALGYWAHVLDRYSDLVPEDLRY